MSPKKVKKLSSILDEILKARGMGSRLKESRVFGRWEKIVGAVIARHAQPQSVRGKKLSVQVDNSSWMQQLSLLKPELIEKVNRALGGGAIQDITLRLGEVAVSSKPTEDAAPPASLDEGERRKVEQYIKDIKDPVVKEALRHVIEKDLMSKKRGK